MSTSRPGTFELTEKLLDLAKMTIEKVAKWSGDRFVLCQEAEVVG